MASHSGFPWVQYGYTILGILVSIILPILRKQLPAAVGLAAPNATAVWTYLVVGAFSVLTALLIVAYGGDATPTWPWYTAILAGYAWDSTLQKVVHG